MEQGHATKGPADSCAFLQVNNNGQSALERKCLKPFTLMDVRATTPLGSMCLPCERYYVHGKVHTMAITGPLTEQRIFEAGVYLGLLTMVAFIALEAVRLAGV